MMRSLVCIFVVAALAGCLQQSAMSADKPGPVLHHPAPVFSREDLAHHRVDLSGYKGQVVLLNFWATWCAPCQVEMPRFAQWQNKYGKRGFQVIAVSMDDDPTLVLAFTHKHPVPFPVVMGDAELGTQYGGVLGLPVTFLIDRHGVVAARFQGEPDLAHVEAKIRRLLDQP